MLARRFAPVLICCLVVGFASAQTTSVVESLKRKGKQPIEVGTVDWGRDLEAAMSSSRDSGKPVLVLFQEVPGCAGCQKFGREVLSQPLLAEAIESEFEPVLVYNNRGGKDAALLKKFGEPSWNYQVIRFLNAEGKDIVPRKDRIWSTAGVARRMIDALEKSDRKIPKYLSTLSPYSDAEDRSFAAFSMHCFWTGEYQLGKIGGVVGTQAGFLDGHEVTLVQYDKSAISLKRLAAEAAKVKCANKVYTIEGKSLAGLPGGKLNNTYRVASDSDQKRQIQRWTAIRSVPGINNMQLTKINSFAPHNTEMALAWLSPRQRAFLSAK